MKRTKNKTQLAYDFNAMCKDIEEIRKAIIHDFAQKEGLSDKEAEKRIEELTQRYYETEVELPEYKIEV